MRLMVSHIEHHSIDHLIHPSQHVPAIVGHVLRQIGNGVNMPTVEMTEMLARASYGAEFFNQ